MVHFLFNHSRASRNVTISASQCSAFVTQVRRSGGWSQTRPNPTPSASAGDATNNKTNLLPPLSLLPASTLLRSLLIATISSHNFLLSPSLSVLSFLSKPRTNPLFNVHRNPLLHCLLKKTFYKQFCAGETGAETKATVQKLKDLGFNGVILTYARETAFDHSANTGHTQGFAARKEGQDQFCSSIEAWRKGTLETVDLIGECDYLAVKLTGAGPLVTDAFAAGELPPAQMMDAMHEVCARAKERKVRILVDGESQHFQKGIRRLALELMRRYNRDGFARVYNTYQAYLKNATDTLAADLDAASREGFTLGMKVVRGAYIHSDQRTLIHDTKEDTDNAYNFISQGALRQHIGEFGGSGGHPFPSVNLFLAGHNKASLMAAHGLHEQRVAAKLPTVPVRFGQLHGMSDEVSFGLLQLKGISQAPPEVYKCSTWGSMTECLVYLLRRAVENRSALSRTEGEYIALKAEVRRRLKALFSPVPS